MSEYHENQHEVFSARCDVVYVLTVNLSEIAAIEYRAVGQSLF